jgi:hypothetical protein
MAISSTSEMALRLKAREQVFFFRDLIRDKSIFCSSG